MLFIIHGLLIGRFSFLDIGLKGACLSMIILKMFVSLVTSSLIEVFEKEDQISDKLASMPIRKFSRLKNLMHRLYFELCLKDCFIFLALIKVGKWSDNANKQTPQIVSILTMFVQIWSKRDELQLLANLVGTFII